METTKIKKIAKAKAEVIFTNDFFRIYDFKNSTAKDAVITNESILLLIHKDNTLEVGKAIKILKIAMLCEVIDKKMIKEHLLIQDEMEDVIWNFAVTPEKVFLCGNMVHIKKHLKEYAKFVKKLSEEKKI